MALLRKLFNKKPPDGLLEIAERVFDAMEDNEFKVYIEGIVGQLHDGFPEASYMVFEFREGNTQTLIGDILSKYDMTVVDYPRHYGRCPLLSLETIYHFLKSSESWLSVGEHNVLLMNCERGGWPVLAFVLSAFVLYMKQHNGEQKTLDMIYKQGPSDLLPLISPLNPIPSQIRYLQYVSRRNVGMQWPPPDRQLLLDCVILRVIPLFDRAGGCRPIFKVYGQDPKVVANRTPKVLFSTPKKGKLVRHYKQADCPLVKIDIRCHVQGDVVVECINLDDDLEREEMIFRAMFNTAFIRSNILMLNRDDIDMFWHCKDRFAKEFRAEILFSEMDAAISPISNKIHGTEEKGLPMEAFARVQEFFSNVDWLDTKTEIALDVLQQIAQSTILQEKLETGSSISVETGNVLLKLVPENFQEKKVLGAAESRSPSKMAELKQSTPALKLSIDVKDSEPKEQVQPAQSKIISQRTPQTAVSPPVPNSNSCQSAPTPLGITTVLHDHGESSSEEAAHLVTSSSSSPSSQSKSIRSVPGTTEGSTPTPTISVSINSPPSLHAPVEDPTGLEKTSKTSSSTTPVVNSSLTTPLPQPPHPTPGKPPSSGSAAPPRPPSSSKKPPPSGHADSSSTPPPPVPLDSSQSAPSKPSPMLMKSVSISGPTPPPPPPIARSVSGRVADPAPSPPPPPPSLSRATSSRIDPPPPPPGLSRTSSAGGPPPPPPPGLSQTSSAGGPPPPPPPGLSRTSSAGGPPPPPPPSLSRTSSAGGPPPPPPPGLSRTSSSGGPPPPPPSKMGSMPNGKGPPGGPLLSRGRNISRASSNGAPRTNLKPYHWLKLTRAAQGSLWDETQKSDESSMPPEIDLSELERLFAVASPKGKAKGGKGAGAAPPKPEKVQLIDLRRAYNCEIMLSKVKIPLPELVNAVLAMDDSTLDIDQVDNLIKFCPTKEEMETLKNYTGNKENLGKCEQFFLELMKVPRIEAKLRVFSFKIQFTVQASDLRTNLTIVNSAADEIRNSTKLKRVMQTILSLGNALNHGTARGSAIGFRLDSLLKLTDTRARNNKMTLMHYLCKVISEKLPEILEFPKDLVSLEAATKLQLKFLAEEMQAISKGLEKVEQELTGASNDGPVSAEFCKLLREFLGFAEADVRSLTSIYSVVGRNADALALYFGEDPARCPFEQVVSTLLIFARMFTRAHTENIKQIELDKKKAEKDALNEKKQKEAEQIEIMKKEKEAKQSEAMKKQKEEAEESEAMKEKEAKQSEAMKKEKEVEQSEAMKKEKEEAKQSEAMKKEKESEQSEMMNSKKDTEQCMQIPMTN